MTVAADSSTARTSSTRTEPRVRSLDDLAALDVQALGVLYRGASAPASMAELDGDLIGRMLAVRLLDGGPALRAVASIARDVRFPWGGKSFRATDARVGAGINRVHLGGRHRLFPFATRVGPSVLDGAPAVILDYDLPENPGFIRAIHDEVRAVTPGLFLGPACWKRASEAPALVLWFALDARGHGRDARAS